MNTNNIEVNIKITSFEDLYKYAKLQFEAFNKVENRPSYNEGYQFDIDDPQDQMWFKQFIQMRFCEELSEAAHARDNEQHFAEEITDANNFLLAAMIMVGRTPKDLLKVNLEPQVIENWVEDSWFASLHNAAHWLCNLLKNRPWTQSHFPVSKKEFANRLDNLWNMWKLYLAHLNIPNEVIFDNFARKYCVNMFRIRSKY